MSRGRLRIYLGAAPGVGKTHAMLGEGARRAARGTDVVVGYVETHGRPQTEAQLEGLEVVPRRRLTHRGTAFEEMDLDAVLQRAPDVALVDEYAHTDVPGSRHAKRWEDVEELLDAGIDVISTLNIQHLESLNDVVESITGIQQRETIPDDVVRAADQVELVDMTPEAIRRRMAHGNIYAPEKVDAALANYFRPGNLGALRELALLWVADRVDEGLQRYRSQHDIGRPWETRERIVVALTGAPSGEQLIRRAARIAERSRGELLGVHIRASDGRTDAPPELLERHRELLGDLGGEYHELVADDVVEALVRFAHDENATQVVLGASHRSRWAEITRGSVVNRTVRRSGDIDIHVISTGERAEEPRPAVPRRLLTGLPPRRRAAGWAIAVLGPALLTLVLANSRGALDQGSLFLLYQVVVLVAATVGGALPAAAAAVLASAALNWYFTPPFYTWTIDQADDVLALAIFVVVGVLYGLLATAFARRTLVARRSRFEAEALARVAAGLASESDPLPAVLDRIRTTLRLDGISVHTDPDGPAVASAGTEPPASGADVEVLAFDGGVVRIAGALDGDDRSMVRAFTSHLAGAVERRALQGEADRVETLAAADALRTAILRAVSHDLRTPLASVKASVSSLRQRDVDWSEPEREDFLATIEEEADRLDAVIGNLLDASRLEAGAIEPATQHVAVEDVVAGALRSISGLDAHPLDIDVSPEIPLVRADPGLLERALANVVANAVAASPPGVAVRVAASSLGDEVQLRVIDRGPGVAEADRERMFQPFQRPGDAPAGSGVGLGLAVARGIVDAMGGRVAVEDTPGGGLTMVIGLVAAPDADVRPGGG
ncbi:sensor histidine kinase KdpD [Iamia majanohamensis]|uniref:histidine kinase n=1 Tax=Iamia majanohamensis TaxID=467976 RepID=A0AAF0BRR3_9ACTN|nr:sensor histidine kinase KdpD [Iamia majanohamensis]WCO67161.1 sensor histidine kinase KdpD [Iamia majanohamensis]